MVQEHLQGYPFGHAHGQVRIDDAQHRHIGQVRVAHQVIDAGAEGKNRLQIRTAGKQTGFGLPGDAIIDSR